MSFNVALFLKSHLWVILTLCYIFVSIVTVFKCKSSAVEQSHNSGTPSLKKYTVVKHIRNLNINMRNIF